MTWIVTHAREEGDVAARLREDGPMPDKERQARRMDRLYRARDALVMILEAKTLDEAKRIAEEAREERNG